MSGLAPTCLSRTELAQDKKFLETKVAELTSTLELVQNQRNDLRQQFRVRVIQRACFLRRPRNHQAVLCARSGRAGCHLSCCHEDFRAFHPVSG